jgi:hypothetical protein
MVSEEIQSILSGMVGGARYGVKIRLPHAFVMTVLFRRDLSALKKIKMILKLTFFHAAQLGGYVAGYKSGISLLKWLARKHRDRVLTIGRTVDGSDSFGEKLISFLCT